MLYFSVPKMIERPERASESIAPGETRGNRQIRRRPEGSPERLSGGPSGHLYYAPTTGGCTPGYAF